MQTLPLLRRTQIMAVLNVTPDSFSDGGRFSSLDAVVAAASEALKSGADILDVGGESTRPGAQAVPVEVEMARVVPVVKAIASVFPEATISIDTRKSVVARAALQAGARIVNDVSGLQYDPDLAGVTAESGASLVIMHAQGTPETMQLNPEYPRGVVTEVRAFLEHQAELAMRAGIPAERIILDPGFGFGKTLEHNLQLMRALGEFRTLGYRLLAGTSRKRFLALGESDIPASEREALTAASVAMAVSQGADIVRVHDIATQGPVVRFADAVYNAGT